MSPPTDDGVDWSDHAFIDGATDDGKDQMIPQRARRRIGKVCKFVAGLAAVGAVTVLFAPTASALGGQSYGAYVDTQMDRVWGEHSDSLYGGMYSTIWIGHEVVYPARVAGRQYVQVSREIFRGFNSCAYSNGRQYCRANWSPADAQTEPKFLISSATRMEWRGRRVTSASNPDAGFAVKTTVTWSDASGRLIAQDIAWTNANGDYGCITNNCFINQMPGYGAVLYVY